MSRGPERTLAHTLAWAADGAAHLRGLMTRMGDDAFAAPSALPGWSRAHLLTHVARNADAMVNLLTWARTEVATPAYASPEQRDADIEAGAGRTPAAIRADVVDSSDRLAQAARAMPQEAWAGHRPHARQGHPRVGRPVDARQGDVDPRRRPRRGSRLQRPPTPMVVELLSEAAAATGGARRTAPRCAWSRRSRDQTWTVAETSDATTVYGTVPALTAWLLGRSRGRDLRTADGGALPKLPAWL